MTAVKIEEIRNAILGELAESCRCAIFNDSIDEESLTCLMDSPNSVTYQAQLSGTSEVDSASFLTLIKNWVSKGPTIPVGGMLLSVEEDCNGAGCSDSERDSANTGVIVGVLIAIILLL